TEQHRRRFAIHAAGPIHDGTHGRVTGRLEDAGRAHGAADRQQRGAGRSLCPDRTKPRRAEPGDECRVGKRLDVLHEGWQVVNPALKWPWWDDLGLGEMAGDA